MFAQVSTIALEAVKACVKVVHAQEGKAVAKMMQAVIADLWVVKRVRAAQLLDLEIHEHDPAIRGSNIRTVVTCKPKMRKIFDTTEKQKNNGIR